MKKKFYIILIIVVLIIGIIIANFNKKIEKKDNDFKILTSFYPIYIMTLNITEGAKNIKVDNMAESNTGCIHDYTLNTADLKKFENSNIFIENGKDLEQFTENIKELYPNVEIIDSAENIEKLIESEEEKNPHIWLSIDNYISQVNTIAENLSKIDLENKDIYIENSNNYINKLRNLNDKFEILRDINNKKAVCLNEALEYLLEDLKINAFSISTDHEQSALSAETIKKIIDKMKEENIKVIFIDKEDNKNIATTLSNETGAKVVTLNSAMNGENNKDEYLNIMMENLEVLKNVEF